MKQQHLSENELQQFALEQQETGHEMAAHVNECVQCATAIANYRAMFTALSVMEKPVFNFDVEKQVMAHLPASSTAKSGFPWSLLLLSAIAMAILAIPLFLLSSSFKSLFTGIPDMILYILVVTTLTIIIFQCREMWAFYREKMNLLQFY